MIKDKFVQVRWNQRVKDHFVELGYVFTRTRDWFVVPIEHLPPDSCVEITSICDECGAERIQVFARYRPLCRTCYAKSAEKRAKLSVAMKRRSADPEFLKAQSERLKAAWSDPARRQNASEKARQRWSNPEQRAHAAEMTRLSWRDEELRATRSGTNHWAYNPDKTDEERQKARMFPDYKVWRLAVYERDDYTCQCCGKRGGNIEAHHMWSYHAHKPLRTIVPNGITLCERCHDEFHRAYGSMNNTPMQLHEFLQSHTSISGVAEQIVLDAVLLVEERSDSHIAI